MTQYIADRTVFIGGSLCKPGTAFTLAEGVKPEAFMTEVKAEKPAKAEEKKGDEADTLAKIAKQAEKLAEPKGAKGQARV